jgi:phosphatidylinositol alpha-1,6-mannosyltransferase
MSPPRTELTPPPGRQLHLAIPTLDFSPCVGGVQTYLFEIAQRLGTEHMVTVVTPGDEKTTGSTSFRRREPLNTNAIGFWRALHSLRPDRVLVGHAHPKLLLAAALAPWKGYATLAYGNDYLAAQRRWHRPLFNWLLGNSRPLITITRANADRLQQLGLPEPVVVYPGTTPLRFTPAPIPPPYPPTLLTVGRLVPRKGIDTVLEALPELLADFQYLRYHVVGEGPDRPRLERMARELRVAHAVQFLGRVSEEDLPKIYQAAHIFVMPAREVHEAASMEGFGIVYLEANASGLPVVAGCSGGAVEAVRHGETGFLVSPDDPQALAQVLKRLLADPDLRFRMGQAGRQWVVTFMNWDRTAAEIDTALLEHR